jgi:hypothetical protein
VGGLCLVIKVLVSHRARWILLADHGYIRALHSARPLWLVLVISTLWLGWPSLCIIAIVIVLIWLLLLSIWSIIAILLVKLVYVRVTIVVTFVNRVSLSLLRTWVEWCTDAAALTSPLSNLATEWVGIVTF